MVVWSGQGLKLESNGQQMVYWMDCFFLFVLMRFSLLLLVLSVYLLGIKCQLNSGVHYLIIT